MEDDSLYKELSKAEKSLSNVIDEYNGNSIIDFASVRSEFIEEYKRYFEFIKKMPIADFLEMSLLDSISNNTDIIDTVNSYFMKYYSIGSNSDINNIQLYFNDVKRVYDKHNNNFDIEYSDENREKLIEMNLKSVIAVAKTFRDKGVPFEDLISAGNYGLCKAFDKYDPERSVIKDKLIDYITDNIEDGIISESMKEQIFEMCKYGNVKNKISKLFESKNEITKEKLLKWVKSNVQNACFNSVAIMWIKAYIIEELNNHARPVKKPKTEIDRELKYNKTVGGDNPYRDKFISLDDDISDDSRYKISEIFLYDDEASAEDRDYAMTKLKETLKILMTGIKSRDRRIVMERFGLGFPREMTPREISDRENLSVARVCQIVNNCIDIMKSNAEKSNINPKQVFELLTDI